MFFFFFKKRPDNYIEKEIIKLKSKFQEKIEVIVVL